MVEPPTPPIRTGGRRKTLTVLGEWIVYFCQVLAVTQPELAALMGVSQPTLSLMTRVQRDGRIPKTSPGTLEKLLAALKALYEERGLDWHTDWDNVVWNAAGFASPRQQAYASGLIAELQQTRQRTLLREKQRQIQQNRRAARKRS